jgi:hypothetical protein
MLTGSFWVMLFNRIFKHKEEGRLVEGIGIVVSVIVMTVLTGF